jgi:TonB family protein
MILAAAAALAALQAPAPAPVLDRDVTSRGTVYHPNVVLRLDQPDDAEPGFYRRVGPQWHDLNLGAYPGPAFAARRQGTVGLRLTVDAEGRITGCAVTARSGAASLDAHACPHVRRGARLHPALDEAGVRRGGTVSARLSYYLHRQIHTPSFSVGPPPLPQPVARLTPEMAGIGADTPRAPGSWGVSGWLRVGPDGRVLACTLATATLNDALDRRICERLRSEARFNPRRNDAGEPIAGSHYFSIGWPSH